MYIIRGVRNLPAEYRGAVVTIGNFDGVHRGHQAIFQQVCAQAREMPAPAMAVTFEPHPRRLLAPERAPARICTVRSKARWMAAYGMDAMFILHFNRALAGLPPEEFVRSFLVEELSISGIMVGYDFRFGAGGRGNFPLLQQLGGEHGFLVEQSPPLLLLDEPVSSTRVRRAVMARDFTLAATLLGRPFEIEGRVVGGQQRGRQLGFPTANLGLTELLHPPSGVYVVEGWVAGQWLPGVANLGSNPTFGEHVPRLEIHLLRPCGDLYHQPLRVRFRHWLRDETRFADKTELIAQIERDIQRAEELLQSSMVM